MHLLLISLRRYAQLIGQALVSPFVDRRRLGGTLLVLVALPVFLVWQLVHWLGFLCDEVFFRGYRRIAITAPVFIIGPPRSGTTHLHHAMARDGNTTTFRTWECLFGLSVTERKLCLALARLDAGLGGPVARLARWSGRRLFRSMDGIHPVSLTAPEEDFLCLLPLAACFPLVVPFPNARWLWRTARFDTELGAQQRAAVLAYYRSCIQKHLYVFGADKRFLSKNASFCGMVQSLLDEFPDARILAPYRDPVATVPSQLSALRPALSLCGFAEVSETFRDRLVDLLAFYYEHLAEVADANPAKIAVVDNDELRDDLAASVLGALAAVDLAPNPRFVAELQTLSAAARGHTSSHEYTLEEFGLDAKLIRSRFAHVHGRDAMTPQRRQQGTA